MHYKRYGALFGFVTGLLIWDPINMALAADGAAAAPREIKQIRTYALTAAWNCGLRYSLPDIKVRTNSATTPLKRVCCTW